MTTPPEITPEEASKVDEIAEEISVYLQATRLREVNENDSDMRIIARFVLAEVEKERAKVIHELGMTAMQHNDPHRYILEQFGMQHA